MKIDADTCDPAVVSRFFDGELDPIDCESIKQHICNCLECEKLMEDLKTISGHIRTHMADHRAGKGQVAVESGIIDTIRKRNLSRWASARETLFSRKALIPAAALVSLVLVALTFFRSPAVTGPSAIITSLSGDMSSVIIMETPDTGHTILWFTESS